MNNARNVIDDFLDESPLWLPTDDPLEASAMHRRLKAECDLDEDLDSPVPRWVLNCLMCNVLGYRGRIAIVLRHHEKVSGQKIANQFLTARRLTNSMKRSLLARKKKRLKQMQEAQKYKEKYGEQGNN